MKTRNYTKFGVWLSIISLIIAFSALNPARAKRIACKVAVFFELYGSLRECQYGCGENKGKPLPKKKKISKAEPKKIASVSETSTSCSATAPNYLSFGAGQNHLLIFGFAHLILFFVVKVIVNIFRKLGG